MMAQGGPKGPQMRPKGCPKDVFSASFLSGDRFFLQRHTAHHTRPPKTPKDDPSDPQNCAGAWTVVRNQHLHFLVADAKKRPK